MTDTNYSGLLKRHDAVKARWERAVERCEDARRKLDLTECAERDAYEEWRSIIAEMEEHRSSFNPNRKE